ncbi:hypothetical protein EZ313_02190 [Ramlibacter henchirensis]|uniref:STAS/SEC14 domain-containing protein n=2 Tax=Ramlibacter henchirensis TaxID=204072 RepID=A0A4Z0C1W6_9BURK|nr:hypothetical protein EZ313_02190 [Ramlibacter henchirensis]
MFTVSVEYGPSMVLIACSGPATATEICSALWFGGEIARRAKRPQFLFDLLAVDFEGTDGDREEIGLVAASLLGRVDRVAVVLSAAQNTGVGERFARESGLKLCNFESLAPAIDWLTA